MHQQTPTHRPAAPRRTADQGGAAALVLGAAATVVIVVLAAFLFMGNFLAGLGEEPVQAREVDEGRLSDTAYASVDLGTAKEAVLTSLRPVLPVYSRAIDRYQLREPETVAAECVYYDRADGRAGQQFRFCFAEDVLIDKTVLLSGDPGEGSAVIEEDI